MRCFSSYDFCLQPDDGWGPVVIDFAVGRVHEANVFCHEIDLSWTCEPSDAAQTPSQRKSNAEAIAMSTLTSVQKNKQSCHAVKGRHVNNQTSSLSLTVLLNFMEGEKGRT